jgi:melibiose permease/lactose/raffinose/galactose permease
MTFGFLMVVAGYLGMVLVGSLIPSSPTMDATAWAKFIVLMIFNGIALCGQQGFFYMILTISLANTIEYNDWKTGSREEGIIFALRPLMAKLGSGIMQLLMLGIYLAVGVLNYTNQISDLENNSARGLISPEEKLEGIQAVINSVPSGKKIALLICMAVSMISLVTLAYLLYRKKYKIDEKMYNQIIEEIEKRKLEESKK